MKLWASKIIYLFLFSLLMTYCFGQDIRLENSTDSRKVNETDIVEIVVKNIYPSEEKKCCEISIITGSIKSIIGDSVLLHISNLRIKNNNDEISKEMQFHWEADNKLQWISQKDILHLIHYKSSKGIKIRKAKAISGVLLVCGGAISMINTLITGNKEIRNKSLTLGGIEMGAGFIIGMLSTKTKYRFRDTDDPWELYQE